MKAWEKVALGIGGAAALYIGWNMVKRGSVASTSSTQPPRMVGGIVPAQGGGGNSTGQIVSTAIQALPGTINAISDAIDSFSA